jgi:hypothetical protein
MNAIAQVGDMWPIRHAQLFEAHTIFEHVEQSHATTQQKWRNVDDDLVDQSHPERLFAR